MRATEQSSAPGVVPATGGRPTGGRPLHPVPAPAGPPFATAVSPAAAPATAPPSADGSSPAVPPVVALEHVAIRFGDVDALVDLSLWVPPAGITVLLGPNGAGKTTAIRLMTGALVPDGGVVRTFGLDPDREGHLVRPRCGVVSAKPALYDRLSGRDNLEYAAALHGMAGAVDGRVVEAAERFGIAEALDEFVGGYSTGMKTRLALARSVLHDPELLLFDEPTSGLDPESAHATLGLIRELAGAGRTVVMCTHLLAEAEGLADRVVVMDGGRDLVSGTPDELTRLYWPQPLLLLGAEDPRLLDRVASYPGVRAYRRDGGAATVELEALAVVPDVVAALCADGVRLTRVEPHQPTLEDLYFAVRAQGVDRR